MANPAGTYLHIQRLSTEDGPGIRTTVFLKGCSLRCLWCHNPESLFPYQQLQRIETNCIQCGSCIEICPHGCLRQGADFVEIIREDCDGCGLCVEECPASALELLGTRVTVDELYAELLKDQNYYLSSGGGVTLSGGEPALQANFCAVLLNRLQNAGIHTALDTCGMVSARNLEKILPFTDLLLYDLKEIDPIKHTQFTGQDNSVILNNLLIIRDMIRQQFPNTRLWIRTPLIPGATASRENLLGLGDYIAQELGDLVERWELCAFNNLCQDKYKRLGIAWSFSDTSLLTEHELEQLGNWSRESGFESSKIVTTGATQVHA